jgi:signal transduction histidine kinase
MPNIEIEPTIVRLSFWVGTQHEGGAETQGTGLGLAIVKKTVDLLGGNIEAKSTEDSGTTIAMRFGDY